MLLASVKAFDCDYTMLEELLTDALEKEPKGAEEKYNRTNTGGR